MSRYKHGDYFPFYWEYEASYHAAKGHLTEEEFLKAWKRETMEGEEPEARGQYGEIRHLFARWGWMDTGGWGWECGEPVQTLQFYEDQGRGEFPVTVIFRKGDQQ